MALAAGLHDVGATEPRGRIGYGADIMSSVTVVALGGFHVTQLGDLAVVRVEVGFGDGLMTPAALVHDVEAEVGEIGAPDGVRGVAIAAHRQLLGGVGHLGGVNAGDERLVDAVMAPPAGGRHVAGVDAGTQVAGGELAVRGVAVGAIGRHRQPALQQPLAVNALLIIFHDIGLGAFITERRPLPRAVAIAAQGRNVARKGRRVGIVPAQDSVFAVTVRAGGRVRAALRPATGHECSAGSLRRRWRGKPSNRPWR